jgi:hypothetical protein
MYPSRRFLAGLTAFAALAVPAQASAHDRASARTVDSHLARATQALDEVAARVAADDQAAAAVAFARNRLEMRRAQAETARLKGTRAARALQALVRRQDANAETFVALAAPATGAAELAVAKGAAASVKGRDRALAELAALAGRLPAPAREAIARAMTAVAQDSEADVEAIAASIDSAAVSDAAKPWLGLALAQATAGIGTAIGQLEALLPQLPAAAQGPVQQALDRVRGVLDMVGGILQSIFGGGAGDAPTTGLPIPGGVPIPDLSKLPIPGGLPIPFGIGG